MFARTLLSFSAAPWKSMESEILVTCMFAFVRDHDSIASTNLLVTPCTCDGRLDGLPYIRSVIVENKPTSKQGGKTSAFVYALV